MPIPWRRLPLCAACLTLIPLLLTGCSSLPGVKQERAFANIAEGDRQLDLGNETRARFWFDKGVGFAPNSAETYLGPDYMRGYQPYGDLAGGLIGSLARHNEWPSMEHYLSRAVVNPQLSNQWPIWTQLAEAQQTLGETQASEASYQHALDIMSGGKTGPMLALQPGVFQDQYVEAEWYTGQRARTRTDLMRTIRFHSNEAADAENELAWLEAVSNVNLPESLKLAATAVNTARASGQPSEIVGEYLDTLGWAQFRAKQYPQAQQSLEEAAGDIPSEPVTHYHLAVTYAALHQTQAAQIEIGRAIYLSPSDADNKAAYQQIMGHAPPAQS